MSSNKIRNLKLRRSSQRVEPASKAQVQDISMILAEETKTHVERIEKLEKQEELLTLTPVHSTPKRSSGKSNDTQDQAMLQHRVSPIFLPCTQDGGNEVAWDWHSPLTKSTSRKCGTNVEPAGTPKRTTALQKKRSSNSPLLYKPIKRQLMKSDPQQESIDKFTAEMKALSEQIKTVPKNNQNSANRADNQDANDDGLLIEIDIDDFKGDTKFQVTTSDESSSRNNVVLKTSLDDFFDDSIDDSMVKCSQEVEEKLKLESGGENLSNSNSTNGSNGAKDFSWHQQSRFLAAIDRSGDEAGSSSKLSVATNSKNSSNARGVVIPTNEVKRRSTTSMTTGSSSSSMYSRNETKSSFSTTTTTTSSKSSSSSTATSTSFGNKSNTAASKSSNFSIKVPTNEAKRLNPVKSMTSISSKTSSFNDNAKETSKQLSETGALSLDDIYEIPDDSFDDFLAVCFDDATVPSATTASSTNDQGNNQSSSRYGKTYEAANATRAGGNLQRSETSSAKKVLLPPPQPSSNSNSTITTTGNAFKGNSGVRRDASATTVFPRSVSNDSLKATSSSGSRTSVPQSQSSTSTSQTRKFFKSKSLSTSSFDDQASKNVINASSSSSKGWKSNLFSNGNISSVSTEKSKMHQANTCQNNAWPRSNGNGGNTGMYNVNRNGPRKDDDIRYKQTNGNAKIEGREVATGSHSIQICTPEEIERKRLEAKMKLEAKKKLLARSTSSGALSGGSLNRPVKR